MFLFATIALFAAVAPADQVLLEEDFEGQELAFLESEEFAYDDLDEVVLLDGDLVDKVEDEEVIEIQ